MEKQEAKSKWDELARQLGADVSPEIEQLVETGPPPPSAPVSSSVRASSEADDEHRPPVPKRPAAGWDNLASEFGLPVPEEPEPIVDEVAPVSKHEIEPRDVEADRPRRDRSGHGRQERYDKRRESSGRGDESSERGRESAARGRESSERGRESSERGRGASGRGRDASERRRDSSSRRGERPHKHRESRDRRDVVESGEESADAPTLERDAPSTVQHEREEQKPERAEQPSMLGPAVSLWHKIFGSPADQSAKIEEISSRQDEQEVTSDVREERSMPRDSNFDRDLADDDVVEAPAQDDIEPGIESEQDERGDRRPRRTRRRRRGRGGKDEPTSDGGSRVHRKPHRADDMEARGELDQGADDDDDSRLDLPDDDENGMADDGDSTEAGTSRAARSRAALQRSIPSWDEAIGFIVDVNMQSRSQRRQSGHGSSPRGRSRGRRKN